MADQRFLALLAAYRTRFRVASICQGTVIAAALSGLVLSGAAYGALAPAAVRVAAIATLLLTAAFLMIRGWRVWTLSRVAAALESRMPLDNLAITAAEVAFGRTAIRHPALRTELFDTAVARLERVESGVLQPLARPVAVASLAFAAIVVLIVMTPSGRTEAAGFAPAAPAPETTTLAPGDLRVTVTPPDYVREEPVSAVNPREVVALEGSRVRLEVVSTGDLLLQELNGQHTTFTREADRAVLELRATSSRPLLIREVNATGATVDRLVSLRVETDRRPEVAIRQPAKDLVFAEGRGEVPLEIEARDDVALRSLTLRYTHVSGSGETFTFEEGEWPLAITRASEKAWHARASLSLERLKLQDGDTVVYRAVSHDGKPGADPSSSETYVIEIGRLAGVAAQGFALPEERDRQAISQQMLIIKTERLHAERTKLSADAVIEQARLLAIEQRMVKAEFVFMTGGEVQDEVEEATHAHELAEGRMENSAQVELFAAIREMSRAEARLNAGDTAQALQFERAALKALQRAFDRRRYLLRTLPERTRIDVTRRLTGEMDTARSSSAAAAEARVDPVVEQARSVLKALETNDVPETEIARIGSQMLTLDPTSSSLQNAALQLAATGDAGSRTAAVRQAREAIVRFLQQRMTPQLTLPIERQPIRGRLVQELTGNGRQQ